MTILCKSQALIVVFAFSNFGLFYILLNVAVGIMLHCAKVSNLKVMLKPLTVASKVI